VSEDADEVPHLTPEVVADDAALAAAIQNVMATPEMSDAVSEIAVYAMDLGENLDPYDWKLVLASHQVEAAFWRRVAAWAFEQGRRYPLPVSTGGAA
jgi:hypothetical protein